MSIIDAGTLELIKEINKNISIYSSSDCYQLACGAWENYSLESHIEVGKEVEEIKNIAFDFIKNSLLNGNRITEYDVQQLIVNEFSKRDLVTEDVPVVAVNQNSSNPHYEPGPSLYTEINIGDWVLIDLWAKYYNRTAVFSDITWVGYMGEVVPSKYIEIFEIVKEMRDSVVTLLENNWKKGSVIEGWEADEEARKIARKYNMVSNLGKILDPIADKLSQIAIVIILLVKFWDGPLKYILFLFIFKELLMIIGAAILMSKGMRPVAAEVWGKLATVVFYTFMITIIAIGPDGALLSIDFFKGLELNNTVIMIMVIISAILAFASLFGYAPGFIRQLKENKEKSDSSEK